MPSPAAKISFLDAIERGGLIGDGAMGSLLYERGIFANRNFDELSQSQPELLQKIHGDYARAGALVHETNTFGANRIRLGRAGLEASTATLNRLAVENARAGAGHDAYVAGAMGPTGLNAGELRRRASEVRAAYKEQAYLLAEAGADAIIIETFTSVPELEIAIKSVRSTTQIPIVAQVVVGMNGQVSDGTPPEDLAREMHGWGADVVGANCNGPDLVFDAVEKMCRTGLPICAFPNAGRPHSVDDRLIYLATPENFGVYARRMFKAGVKLVGGCCGTGPDHIARVRSAARMVVPEVFGRVSVSVPDSRAQPRVPAEQRSGFGAKLGRRFTVSVEINPPPGLEVQPSFDAARMLVDAGADIINIADGPRASVRMSNLSFAARMQGALGIETLVHMCTRDRNLLSLQASVLGAHIDGLRNLVCITGDPPKLGDYPDATAVYDIDSIGLLGMIDGLNRGLDPAGKTMRSKTSFVLATGCEPAAMDFEREMNRLREKVAAGADLIMTQPVYDPAHLDRFFDATSDLDVPVLVGILPLASYKNAAFLHTNVPGMAVPEAILKRMKAAGSGAEARRVGIEIACEVISELREKVAGAYIMPPLGRYEMAAEIIESLSPDRKVRRSARGFRGDETLAG